LAFALDMYRVELQCAHWEGVLKQHGSHRATERVLANLRNTVRVRDLAEQVQRAQSLLIMQTQEGYPVVYAVHADRRWVQGPAALTAEDCELGPFGDIR